MQTDGEIISIVFHEDDEEKAPEVKPAKPLHYLDFFSSDEIKSLVNQYQKTPAELEAIVAEFHRLFRWEWTHNWIAKGSNAALTLIFLISTSNDALNRIVAVIDPGITVSPAVANGISIPISVFATLIYIVAFSAHKEAVFTVLDYTQRESVQERFSATLQEMHKVPPRAILNGIKWLTNQTVLTTMTLTAAMQQVIPLGGLLSQSSLLTQVPVDLLLLYYGKRYYSHYMDRSYYKGLEFLSDPEKRPTFTELKQNLAISGQSVLQIVSAIGLRVYFFHYLAEASEQALGWWPSPFFVDAMILIHSTAMLSPATLNYYFNDGRELKKLLSDQFQHLPATEQEASVNQRIQQLAQQVSEKEGWFFLLKKDKAGNLLLLCRSAIGSYFGSEIALLVSTNSVALPVCSAVFFAGVFGAFLYKAELNRLVKKLSYDLEKKQDSLPSQILTVNEAVASFAGKVINITSSIANATALIAAASRLLGNNLPVLNSVIDLFAVEKGVNNAKFNGGRIENTIMSAVPKGNWLKENYLSTACMRFFKKRAPTMSAPVVEMAVATGLRKN
jgi:hypothetical protein